MKFIYLLCLSVIIFSYVKADEEDAHDNSEEEDSLYPREYYQVPNEVEKSPPHSPPSSYGYPDNKIEVSTIPSLKDKFNQAKKKFAETKKKLEKDLHDKIAALKQKKLEKLKKTKTTTTTTPEPLAIYVHKKATKKIVKVKKAKKSKKSKKCNLLYKAMYE